MANEPQSIRGLFVSAERARKDLSSSYDSNSPAFQENLNTAIATYQECLKLAEQVSLFSPNETLEDISSTDLQYMTINHHLAELGQKISSTDVSVRKKNILQARVYYERFLKLLDSYDALSKSDARLFETYTEDKENFATASTRDAAARRDAKITRFREEKELKRKLEYLQQNPKLAENDEQVVRELHLTNLAFMVHQTFQSLESIAQELHIISLAPPTPTQRQIAPGPDERQDGRNKDTYSERLDGQLPGLKYSGPILSPDGKPMRPFTLLDSRQTLKKNVFRPDHSLPTMTIDEYLDEEKKRGGIIEGGGPQSEIRPEPNEDDLVAADEETMKQRAWDEFTEENPKGSGNTLNRG
ncbi:type 2A phosphatase-associated protein 42 [Dothidotthia symphoricarpi CBS 119687]|uniref:Type 2A phosphatase-associated protein 42 n=1 Tax=Dothidotthia symphoricarpi CBS 119687 TaxID=1392245 RepID=A0A6A6ABT3_9PLEO|nr:type 2A phosphatase-associated protein 42 [Dothidotthia symphoricarpi CBS 119687]KAF2129259.1 type 2A phosphatase-associated protein 42 [Dothidotthia symphoricarpi CBS 119687]